MEELLVHSFKNKINYSQNESNENKSFINYSNISYLNNSNMKKRKIEIFQNVKNKNKSVEQQKSKIFNNSNSKSKLSNKLNKNNSLSKNIKRKNYNINDIYYNIKKPTFYEFNANIEVNPYQLFKKKNKMIEKENIVNPFLIGNRKKENKIDDDLTTINSSITSFTNNRNISKDDFKNEELGRILLYNKKEKIQRESGKKINKKNEYSFIKNNINNNHNIDNNYIYNKKSNNLSNEKIIQYIKKYIPLNSNKKEEKNKKEILIK